MPSRIDEAGRLGIDDSNSDFQIPKFVCYLHVIKNMVVRTSGHFQNSENIGLP